MTVSAKRLVLLGGGHAHLHVLAEFAKYTGQVDLTLVSPYPRQVYSGMLPGWVSGRYSTDDIAVPLAPLAARANARFVQSAATGLDADARVVHCADGSAVSYDLLSVDTGPVPSLASIAGAAEHALAVRPLEDFIAAWPRARARLLALPRQRVVFVGGGAAGVELAFAVHHDLVTEARGADADVTLISAADTLPGASGPRIKRALAQNGIGMLGNLGARAIEPRGVRLASGAFVDSDLTIVATGTGAAAWPAQAGLQTDPQGFILTDGFLRSLSHPEIFAAGDCGSILGLPRPKSGVYAVRAGPPLARNLQRVLAGELPTRWFPQKRSLYLVSTADGRAIGSWNGFSLEGGWVWRWKDRIDRRFVAQYR